MATENLEIRLNQILTKLKDKELFTTTYLGLLKELTDQNGFEYNEFMSREAIADKIIHGIKISQCLIRISFATINEKSLNSKEVWLPISENYLLWSTEIFGFSAKVCDVFQAVIDSKKYLV